MISSLSCLAQTTEKMDNKIGAIELVQFKLQDGISDQEAIDALKKLNDCVKEFEGFIARKLAHDGSGNWIDMVYWTDKSFALKAAEQVMQNPTALEAFKVIDESSIQMNHFFPSIEFEL